MDADRAMYARPRVKRPRRCWSSRGARAWATSSAEVSTELAPGASIRLQIAMAAPTAPGTWMLEGDVLSRDLGSMAAEGLDGPGLVVTVRPGPGADQPPRG